MIHRIRPKATPAKLGFRLLASAARVMTRGGTDAVLPCLAYALARGASYELFSNDTSRSRVTYWSLLCQRAALIIALFSTVWLAAPPAQAQEVPGNNSKLNSEQLATGWWSLERVQSAAAPHLLLTMADLRHFSASAALGTAIQPASSKPLATLTQSSFAYGPAPDPVVNAAAVGSAFDARGAETSLLLDRDSSASTSLLDSLQTKYQLWESRLADTRPLMKENGVFVYPLLQINFAGKSLPICLYVPPPR